MAESQPSKLVMRVRFPSPAPSARAHFWLTLASRLSSVQLPCNYGDQPQTGQVRRWRVRPTSRSARILDHPIEQGFSDHDPFALPSGGCEVDGPEVSSGLLSTSPPAFCSSR